MQKIRTIIKTPYEVSDTEALWIDTSNAESPVLKVHEQGTWKSLGGEESSDTYELKSNKVTALSASSSDDQYPSAKAVYDAIESGGGGGSAAPYVQYREYGRSNPTDNMPWSFGEVSMTPGGTGDNIEVEGETATILNACFDFKIVTDLPVAKWEVEMIDGYLMFAGFYISDGEQSLFSPQIETQSKEVFVNLFTYGTPESNRTPNCKFGVTVYFGEQDAPGSQGKYTFIASVLGLQRDR